MGGNLQLVAVSTGPQKSETEMPAGMKNDGWSISFALRWGLLFSIYSYIGALPYGRIYVPFVPLAIRLIAPYSNALNVAARWLGAHAFGLKMQGQFWTIGLTTLVPVFPALLWTIFDRRNRVNEVLRDAVYIVVRYTVAAAMFNYGFAKLAEQQGVPEPAPLVWFRPLGETTTGQLMWTWLGYSKTFQFFAGMNEAVGAILLLFRRTTLLGALLILPVMAYVTALDTTFHVGPAAWAALYGIGALYLVALEWRRLAGVFLFGKPTAPRPSKKLWTSPRLALVGRGVWIVAVAITLRGFVLPQVLPQVDIRGRQSPLCGAYRVERFMSDGRVLPGETADPARWREVSINLFADYIRIRRMDESELLWSADPGDPYRFLPATGHSYHYGDYGKLLAKTAGTEEQLRYREMPNWGSPHTPALVPKVALDNPGFMSSYSKGQFFTVSFIRTDSDHVSLQGRIDGVDISADLVRVANDDFAFSETREGLP